MVLGEVHKALLSVKAPGPAHMQPTTDIVLLDFCDAFGFSFL